MFITWNGEKRHVSQGGLLEIVHALDPRADVIVLNGFATNENLQVKDEDSIYTFKKGEMPPDTLMSQLLSSRNSPGTVEILKSSCVGIAGLGGLGSHVALALWRMGIGHLVLVDFDIVEPTNLNRQAYGMNDLGQFKVDALKRQLYAIHPYGKITGYRQRITQANALDYFNGCQVIVEAFDTPQAKADLVHCVLSATEIPIVAASGIAGLYSGNQIRSLQKMGRLYMVGDQEHGAKPGEGLMAPRVMLAAGHQALVTVQLLLGLDI